ncbi:MAG: N-acetylmuramoyl-L-alanine amidase [Erysipelotrichaceae bacterium]|nr:N-acetylmuramoyl-L-alanine amidase [Erysipelotrichaceae bacterium]
MKRRRHLKVRVLLVSTIIFLISIIVILVFLFLFEKKDKEVRYYYNETVLPAMIDDIVVTTKIIPKSSNRRLNEKREIKYIVIHETDNTKKGSDAYKHSQFLLTNSDSITAWHYTVDDKVIYHNLPDNEISWHAGDGRSIDGGNMNGIGIEMCVNIDGDYEKTLKNSAKLISYLIDIYNLSIDDVKLHRDFSGKICPNRLISENRLEDFYKMIIEFKE